jgi:hypothetical protein
MKNDFTSVIAIIIILLACCFSGCGESNKQAQPVDTASLDYNDSLLGEIYNIPATHKSFRPPAGFYTASDTVLEMLQAQLAQNAGQQEGVEMVRCYLDTVHTAGLMISTIEGINFKVDTVGFLERYRGKLYDLFGEKNITEDNFWTGGVLAKRFFVGDSIIVRVQLLCFSNEGDAAEFIFFTPREQYPKLVDYFNASIASIGLTE